MTCWSDVNPRAALLVPLVWPTLYLLAFAVFHMECLQKQIDSLTIDTTTQTTKPGRRPRSLCMRQFLGVWKAMDILSLIFISNTSVFLSLGAIVTTLVFNRERDLSSREDYQHYVLSSIIGQFFGRCAMSLIVAKKPDIRGTPFQAIGVFFSTFFMFLLFMTSWHRFIHSIWGVVMICVIQGMALGITSVISFHQIARDTNPKHIELLLIVASLFETFGMLCAGLIGLHTEPSLFRHCFEIQYGDSKHCLTRVMNDLFWQQGKRLF